MADPVITAIMPAYNTEATIAAAIHSVRGQTISGWELIVLDDGSTDRTLAVARAAAGDDQRVRVMAATHGGRGQARNRCLGQARGSFIAICDSDDISLPQRFEKQAKLLEAHPDVHLVASARIICMTPAPARAFAILGPSSDAAIRRMFDRRRMPIFFASAMIRAEVFRQCGLFDEELHRNQDYGFLVRAYRRLRFDTIAESLILYRTPDLTAARRTVEENNFFRYCANRRATRDTRSAAEIHSSLDGRLYRHLAIPFQYAWYVMNRRVLGRGIETLSTAEARLVADLGHAFS
jgi:glycosyltransferase involved in cell wall biosynthesis